MRDAFKNASKVLNRKILCKTKFSLVINFCLWNFLLFQHFDLCDVFFLIVYGSYKFLFHVFSFIYLHTLFFPIPMKLLSTILFPCFCTFIFLDIIYMIYTVTLALVDLYFSWVYANCYLLLEVQILVTYFNSLFPLYLFLFLFWYECSILFWYFTLRNSSLVFQWNMLF